MAYQIAAASNTFTTLATWLVADATSLLDSIANNTAVTTAYATSRSSTFVPGAITIDGIALKIASRVASPVGTFKVELYDGTGAAAVAGTEVTINVTDIHVGDTAARGGCGWFFFKFAAPVTLTAGGNTYAVECKCSTASEVSLFRDATATNWSRMLRTTTAPASLAAADVFVIMGEWTAAATVTALTVTNDNTATTAWGYIQVGKSGTFSNGTTASTAYYIKTGGDFIISGGTVNFNTSGARLDDTSSFTLFLNSGSVAQYGLRVLSGSTWNAGGATKLSWTRLTSDEAAASTVIGVTSTTGWKASDVLCFSSTTRTASEKETKIISTVDSSTQVTLTAGLTNAHSGTNSTYDTRGEVGNLTRNIVITGASAANSGYVYVGPTAVVSVYDVEFTMLGALVTDKRGIDINTTSGDFNFDNCSVHDFTVATTNGMYVNGALTSITSKINNCVIYNTTYRSIHIAAAFSGAFAITGNLIVGCGDVAIALTDGGCTVTNNVTTSGSSSGFDMSELAALTGTFTGNISHSNLGTGFTLSNFTSSSSWDVTAWRNGSSGMFFSISTGIHTGTVVAFGNAGQGITHSTGFAGLITLTATLNAGVTLTQPLGVLFGGQTYIGIVYIDSLFGNLNAHATADISINTSDVMMRLYNTTLAATTEVLNQTTFRNSPYFPFLISSDKHDQTAGSFKSWYKYGTITTDTVIYNTASPSERMAPNNASNKLVSGSNFIAVNSGATVDVTVYTRKSAAGDGTAYNGAQPRLMIRANPAIGISADTALDTMTVATGNWEQLSGTTAAVTMDGVVEIFVDCDGTTGWVNVDDWATTTNNDPRGLKYWDSGVPSIVAEYNASGGSSFTGFFLQ